MYRITKRFRFEAAHQLDKSFSACCRDCIHGHSYVVEVTLVSNALNGDGMVLDFGILKAAVKEIIEAWDHALLLPPSLVGEYKNTPSKKVVRIPSNPTAEVMAKIIFDHVRQSLADGVAEDVFSNTHGLDVHCVRVQETETGWAEYEG